jgi:hypothetical protein
MTRQKRSNGANYSVGYGRPPIEQRFTAGKSGNPRGRPKGSRTVGAVVRDIVQQKIAVTENGKTRWLPALEVILRQLRNDALRNDPKAMKLLLALVERYAETTEAKVQLGELLAEDQEILAQYLLAPKGHLRGASEDVEERSPESPRGSHETGQGNAN